VIALLEHFVCTAGGGKLRLGSMLLDEQVGGAPNVAVGGHGSKTYSEMRRSPPVAAKALFALSLPKSGGRPMKEQVAEIIAAYLKRNRVDASDLPALIAQVSQSLSTLGQAPVAAPTRLMPAVPIRRSVGAETITCLDCGQKSKMLKRHLMTGHGLTVDEYRSRWGLAPDYPMTARNYSARRSELAKSLGLGRLRKSKG
jgi:predicted transcriptional regulator